MVIIPIGKELFDHLVGEGEFKIKSINPRISELIWEKMIDLLDLNANQIYFLDQKTLRPFILNRALNYCFYKNSDADNFLDYIDYLVKHPEQQTSVFIDTMINFSGWSISCVSDLPKKDLPINNYTFFGGCYDPPAGLHLVEGVYELKFASCNFKKEIRMRVFTVWGNTKKVCIAYPGMFDIYPEYWHRKDLHNFYLNLFYNITTAI